MLLHGVCAAAVGVLAGKPYHGVLALGREDYAVGGTHAESFGFIDIDGLVVLATGYSQKCSYSNQG